MLGTTNAVRKGDSLALNTCVRKERSPANDLTSHLEQLDKKSKLNLARRRRKLRKVRIQQTRT